MSPLWLLPLGLLAACGSPRPDGLGVIEGQLAPCPDSPNCVSSFAEPGDQEHYVAPIRVSLPEEAPFGPVKPLLEEIGSAEEPAIEGNYLHAVFVSRIFRFKDDFELLYDPQAELLHLRSASRLGHSDLGVNRKRAEKLRALLEKP